MADLNSRFFTKHLDDEEELVEVIHKHWFLGIQHLLKPVAGLAAGWFVLYLFPFLFIFYLTSVWSIGCLVWLLRNFFDYYLDALIITNEGIVDVEWHGWFHRTSTRVLYTDIQGVSYEIHGVIGTVLRYGTISIEKISTGDVFELEHVAHPRNVEKLILKMKEAYLHSKNLGDSKHVQELFSQLVAEQVQLRELQDDDEEDGEYEDQDDEDDEDDEDYDDDD